MNEGGPYTSDVHACARCGGDHAQLTFEPLGRPVALAGELPFTHWCACPTTGEPILLRLVPDEEAA